jgi:lysyl-tRNA synthetase class I
MLKVRLDTKLMQRIKLSDIEDFPRLSEKTIQDELIFGSFQIKQSKNYLSDLLQFSTAYSITETLAKKLFDSETSSKLVSKELKLIATEITSRHKRSVNKLTNIKNDQKYTRCSKFFRTTYKTFILYQSGLNISSSIKGMK